MAGLEEQVRRKLRVTWEDDEATDERIDSEIIPAAEQDLRNLLGIPDQEAFDFSKPSTENLLFLNHCYYQWNDAMDEFENNYAAQIGRCRDKWMVKQYVEEQESSDDA